MSRHKYPEHRWLLEEWISAGLHQVPMLLHSALPRKHIAILIGQDLSSCPLLLWQKWVGNRLKHWRAPAAISVESSLPLFHIFHVLASSTNSFRGRNAQHLLATFYTSQHQLAFVARLLHVFYLPWKLCSRLYLCVNDGGKEATWLDSLWFALSWQASSDS